MITEGTRYVVELVCGYPGWWRFNLYMMLIGYDAEGNSLSFKNYTDKVYEVEYGVHRDGPEGFDAAGRVVRIESDPCDHIELYVYAVTNTFPDSESIKDSPPFNATLNIIVNDEQISSESYEVNQWGGLTIAGMRFPVQAVK